MNLKCLLLGSAATLVAITNVRAADVIMVEPEPTNYVRACDVYGAGFFYLPGTETCLRVGGYVRTQINVAGDPAINSEGDDYDVGTAVRVRLNFDVREETELGLLRAYARLQAQNNSAGSAAYVMDQGYIQLGGLLLGYRDSLWTSDIGGLEDGLGVDADLVVGDFNTNQISYTFTSGALSATLGLEDDDTGDVVPDVHGKLVYSGAWGGAFLSAVYDETFNLEDAAASFGNLGIFLPDLPSRRDDGSNDAFALKGGVRFNDVLVEDSSLLFEGHWASDPTSYASIPGLATAGALSAQQGTVSNPTPGAVPIFLEWAVGAGYTQAVGDFSVAVAGQYGETFNTDFFVIGPLGATLASVQGDYYSLVGNIGYNFTNNFGALAEVQYTDVDFGGSVGAVDQTKGFLRFVRSF